LQTVTGGRRRPGSSRPRTTATSAKSRVRPASTPFPASVNSFARSLAREIRAFAGFLRFGSDSALRPWVRFDFGHADSTKVLDSSA
jgi:hypothetical protein